MQAHDQGSEGRGADACASSGEAEPAETCTASGEAEPSESMARQKPSICGLESS